MTTENNNNLIDELVDLIKQYYPTEFHLMIRYINPLLNISG